MRFRFIDGLRGAAMLMVLLYHGWMFSGSWHIYLQFSNRRFDGAAPLSFGHIGVNLFLVLSGFCLYWPFVRTPSAAATPSGREPTLAQFALKRSRRIMPPYLVALVMTLVIVFFQNLLEGNVFTASYWCRWLALHVFMMHNLRTEYILAGNGSLWSLALESQLYVVFPVLVEAFRRFNSRSVLTIVFVFSSLFRLYVSHAGLTPDDGYAYVLAYSVFGRCFEFAIGMYAALRIVDIEQGARLIFRFANVVPFVVIVPIAVLDGRGHGHYQTLTDAMWGLLFAGLLVLASQPSTVLNKALSTRWIVTLGTFSYSIYLVHLPIMALVDVIVQKNQFFDKGGTCAIALFEFVVLIPLIIAFAFLFHLAFERPFMSRPPVKPSKSAMLSAQHGTS